MAIKVNIISKDSFGYVTLKALSREYKTTESAMAEVTRRQAKDSNAVGKLYDADDRVACQYSKYAAYLLSVNPSYILCPERMIGYIKTPNWNGGVGVQNGSLAGYADLEMTLKCYGKEITEFFGELRKTVDSCVAVDRLHELNEKIGICAR